MTTRTESDLLNIDIHNYTTGDLIATVTMTREQIAEYEDQAQMPEGLILARDFPVPLPGVDDMTTVYAEI